MPDLDQYSNCCKKYPGTFTAAAIWRPQLPTLNPDPSSCLTAAQRLQLRYVSTSAAFDDCKLAWPVSVWVGDRTLDLATGFRSSISVNLWGEPSHLCISCIFHTTTTISKSATEPDKSIRSAFQLHHFPTQTSRSQLP